MSKKIKTNMRKWIKTPYGIIALILISSFILMIIGAISDKDIFHKSGRTIFIWSVSALIFLNSVEGLKLGKVYLRGGVVSKSKKPVHFWMSVMVGFGFSLILFIGGIAFLFM